MCQASSAAWPSSVQALSGSHRIPVGAWVAPPPAGICPEHPADQINNRSYRLAKEAGIDILYGLYEAIETHMPDVLRALACAEENHLQYLAISNGTARHQEQEAVLGGMIRAAKDNPSCLGVLAFDEPARPEIARLGPLADAFRAALPDKLFYVNALPYCAKITQLTVSHSDESGRVSTEEEYKAYLSDFLDTLEPPFLSFDNYPCAGPFPQMEPHYFRTLSLAAAAARQHGLPVWCFIQTCSWGPRIRVPNREEILWQVNTALAYGVQGIQYFTFWQPLTDGVWQGGMISPEGEPLPAYRSVQQANRQIRCMEFLLTTGRFCGLMAEGRSPAPIPAEDTLLAFGTLQKITGSIPVIAGCFLRQSGRGVYVVNNSVTAAGTAVLHFHRAVDMTYFQEARKTRLTGSVLTLELDPGAAVYVIWKETTAL